MSLHSVSRASRYVALLLVLLLSFSVVTAQSDDTALLSAAMERLDMAESFSFAADLSLAVEGSHGAGGEISLSATGAISGGNNPALDLTLDGSLIESDGVTPIRVEARLVDGVLYFKTPEMPGWSGLRMDELLPLLETELVSSFQEGFDETANTAQTTDPMSQDALTELQDLLASFDLSAYAMTNRLNDETVGGETLAHFRTTVAIDALMRSPETTELLTGLIKLGDAEAVEALGSAELQQLGILLSQAFRQTSLGAEYYVSTERQELRRMVLRLDLLVDPSALGGDGEPTSVLLHVDVRLTDYDATPAVTAPANAAMLDDFSGMLNGQAVEPALSPTLVPLATTAPTTTTTTTQAGGTISANAPAQIRVSAAAPTDLIYTSPGDETISIVAHSLEEPGTVDTTLELLTMSGTRLAFNDDHGGERPGLHRFDSAIEELRLMDAGDYIIRVTSFSGAAEGNVEVTVESSLSGKPVPVPTDETSRPIDINVVRETDRFTSEVPQGSQFTYYFSATAGQVMTLTVRPGEGSTLDPQVTLYDPDGVELASNNDHADSDPSLSPHDARISDFTLPVDGRYRAVISGVGGMGGAFELEMVRVSAGEAQPDITPTAEAALGQAQVVSDEIDSDSGYVYPLDVNAGDVYTFTAQGLSGDLDPQVYVYDSSDNLIAANDDHSSIDRSLNWQDARIQNMIFQEGGTYTVEVYGYGTTAGRFALTITPVATGAPLGAGEATVETGTIESGGYFSTTFTAQAGDYVTITARALSGDLDPQLALLDPNIELLAGNDDHSSIDQTLSLLDSKIQNFLIPQNGVYTIEVYGYQETSGTVAVTITTLR